ncbi:ictacalcin-like [Pagrus major]|uniref:ictacalcin-like n=1 Tax=Pagrus major TaxID=143350 RepID=UPI003CC8C846
MPELTKAMELLRASFNKHAGKDGNAKSLSKKELSELLHAEFPGAAPECKDKADKFFKTLDNDGDGVVSFEEFVSFAAALTVICAVFDEHAGKEGDPKTLTKKEVCDLLKNDSFPIQPSCQAEVDEFFNMLDGDGDGLVNFREFGTFVLALCEICRKN